MAAAHRTRVLPLQQVKVAVLESLGRVVMVKLSVLGRALTGQGASALVRDDVAHFLLGAQVHGVAQVGHGKVADVRLVSLVMGAETHRLSTRIAATASHGVGADA